ncbi:MAG: hypothetical protein IKU04_05725 [Bacteroidales bacterium]|nr:hypothetical protein [Bacteroidales bacterium]
MKQRIGDILERWFLSEPALFQVMCMHDIVENGNMACAVRTGKRRLEYNPAFVAEMGDEALDQALRTEAIRILLKHPYQRRPEGCSQQAAAVGSNITVGDNYDMPSFNIERPKDFGLSAGEAYEWYSRRIQEMVGHEEEHAGPGCQGVRDLRENEERNTALSELWDEDEITVALIDGIIEGVRSWGTIKGAFAEKLLASTRARINWRNILAGFRGSILSSKRRLTRMRPNRRTGFDNMGSIRRFDTRLLVAVDVSGSISSSDLAHFYGVINSAFRYGFTAVDVVQFDAGVRVVQSLHKVMRDVAVIGRGGTSFQEPIDYAAENGYDGLVMLTDGCAPEPQVPDRMNGRIVWVCNSQKSYDQAHRWMRKSGRVCVMELK